MNNKKTGNLIKELRIEKNLTQKQLGDKLSVTDRAVSKWERGCGYPDVTLLLKLSEILDISILELLKGERLLADEIIPNDKMMNSVVFSERYAKNKLKAKIISFINYTSVFLIIIVLFLNFKVYYQTHKKYENVGKTNAILEVQESINNKIELFKNNQGIYSSEDYELLNSFIDNLNDAFLFEEDAYLVTKSSFTFQDYNQKINIENYFDLYEQTKIHKEIYKVLIPYDSDIIEEFYIIMYLNSMQESISNYVSAEYTNTFKLGYKVQYDVAGNFATLIILKEKEFEKILENILETGEIYE